MDLYIFEKINQFAGKSVCLDSAAIFFAKYFEYFLILGLLVFLLKNCKKYWLMAVQALVAAVFSRFAIVEIIRWFFPKPRPFVGNSVNLLLPHELTSSFPSGHAAFYFALSLVVYSYNKKAGIFFFAASFLISFARVFSGIHWPSDILAGVLIGVFSGWLILKLSKKIVKSGN